MARRESVVPPRLDMQQFVEGIAIRQPGWAFLVRAKKIARRIELHGYCEAHSSANGFSLRPVRRKLLNCSAIAMDVVLGFAGFLVHPIGFVPIITTQPKENSSTRIDRQSDCIQ